MRIWFRCSWRGWCGIDEVLRVVSCHGADASDMTSRQQASLEATMIKTVSGVMKRHSERVIRSGERGSSCHGLLLRLMVDVVWSCDVSFQVRFRRKSRKERKQEENIPGGERHSTRLLLKPYFEKRSFVTVAAGDTLPLEGQEGTSTSH